MDIGILLYQLLRVTVIMVIGLALIKYRVIFIRQLAPVYGRLNRVGFLLRYGLLFIVMMLFHSFIESALMDVVILPAYWFIRFLLFVGLTISVPFYISFIGRRLQDLSIPGYYSIPWVWFLIFAPAYGIMQSTQFMFNLIIIIGTILLLSIPSVQGRNNFGYSND